MITGRDIIFISSIEWDFLWQHPQEIASRFANAGNRVLYLENTGVRSPGIKDVGRVATRLKSWTKALKSRGVREVQPNLFVCSPLVLPPFGSHWKRNINRRLLIPLVCQTASKLGMRDPLIWTHLPTDTALELIRQLRTPRSLVVYYCIADFSKLTPHVTELENSENSLMSLSDIVFANSAQLAQHCRKAGAKVHIFPPGLNLSAFPPEKLEEFTNGTDGLIKRRVDQLQAQMVIGYIGGLHRHLDTSLLLTMARSRPQWLWVFVGPAQTSLGELPKLANVLLIGQQPHRDLHAYIRHFHVCIVPYLLNRETATVFPVKINEYLAAGKPVVATELPAVVEFNAEYRVLSTTPAEPVSFLKAIEIARVSENGAATVANRRRVAVLQNWETRIETMSHLLERASQSKKLQQVR